MARTALQKVYADFRQGFVTVANPLAYPEGSVKDIVNFDIEDNGTLKLRPGLRQESVVSVDTGLTLSEINNKALSVNVWDNVNNIGDDKIAVVQIGSTIYLYNMLDAGIDLENPVTSPINLGIPSAGEDIPISATTGSGWFFIAHPSIRPKILKKDSSNSFVVEDITIKIRDLLLWKGRNDIETGLTFDIYLYPQHEYNLRNGGWPELSYNSKTVDPNDGVFYNDPLAYTRQKIGKYPDVYKSFYFGRAGGGSDVQEQNAYSPWILNNDYFGNSLIPSGRNIVNAEQFSREGKGISKLDDAVGTSNTFQKTYKWKQYPSSIEFYAGRVWYTGAKGYQESQTSGINYNKPDDIDVSNTIYFSQQVESDLEKVGFCYQQNDPTAETINQLLPTDGGTLSIRGAGEILDMKTFGTSLIVFTSQGVWAISGADTNSFKADNFSVNKISNIGPSSRYTISATNNIVYYIANDAIYILTTDQVTGLPTPKDITSDKIKSFYTNLSYESKQKAKALFDPANRNFYMFYSDSANIPDNTSNIYFNKCLIFNQDLGCFYKYEINIASSYIVDGVFYNKDSVVTLTENILVGVDPVVIGLDPVGIISNYSTASLNNIQLLTIKNNTTSCDFFFSSFTDIDNRQDFGEDYTGFVEFGFDTAGDIMRDSHKSPVIISHMQLTEDGFKINPQDPDAQELLLTHSSSCLMSYGWDWATSYKRPIQIYRFNRQYVPTGVDDPFDYGVDVITSKNRIRGKGHSLGIRLDSEPGKDCKVLGLGILYTQSQRI